MQWPRTPPPLTTYEIPMPAIDETDRIEQDLQKRLRQEQQRDADFESRGAHKLPDPAAAADGAGNVPATDTEAEGTRRVRATEPEVRLVDDAQSQPPQWLWPARVALGQLTLAAGEPGAGKSLLLMDLVSRVSRGTAFPGCNEAAHPNAPADVLLITRQSLAEIVKPRLLAAGADLARIRVLGDVPDMKDGAPCTRPFHAATDLAHLEYWLARQTACKLVVIDPLLLWLDPRGRGYAKPCHEMLRELGELAGRWKVAIVAAVHIPERPAAADLRRWLDKLSGAAEIDNLLAVIRDRRRPQRRYVLPIKNNLGGAEEGLWFETPGGRVAWGQRAVSLAALFATAGALDQLDAAEWLREVLSEGQKTAQELRELANQAGIPWHVVYRAKGMAGADCGRVGGGKGSYFVWSLFGTEEPREGTGGAGETAAQERDSAPQARQKDQESSIENEKTAQDSAADATSAPDGAQRRSEQEEPRLVLRFGLSELRVSSVDSDRLWHALTWGGNGPELVQEIERVLRERGDRRMIERDQKRREEIERREREREADEYDDQKSAPTAVEGNAPSDDDGEWGDGDEVEMPFLAREAERAPPIEREDPRFPMRHGSPFSNDLRREIGRFLWGDPS